MGFTEVGTPLTWEESQNIINYIKTHGLQQFLHIWKINHDRNDRILYWGEELEYSLVSLDKESGNSQIYVGASALIEELKVREHIQSKDASAHLSSEWHPEFSNHMIEALPSPPYVLNLNSLLILEPSMRLRRAKIQSVLNADCFVTSMPTFPRLGLKDSIRSPFLNKWGDNSSSHCSSEDGVLEYRADQKVSRSIFVKDELFNPHPRFPTLVTNIAKRRNAKIFIRIPIYKDKFTGQSRTIRALTSANPDIDLPKKHADCYKVEDDWTLAKDIEDLDRFSVAELSKKTLNPVKDTIYMDCTGFGFSMSCVQTTFACPNVEVAAYLYDQLIVLAPLFLTLSASTPFHRGYLSDHDTRWSALEQSADCRTEAEETGNATKDHSGCGATPMKHIPKSRYSAVSLYISNNSIMKQHEEYLNDTNAPIDQTAYDFLRSEGLDHFLAQHYAHLWIRDPLVVFDERTYLDDTRAVDHFENIQSTNWQSVRFKPPPQIGHTQSPIAWRVEFRSPDIQLTDFDNAANVAFISVLAQAILHYKLYFYIPMSMNDENMSRAWQRDAITEQKFYLRTKLYLDATDHIQDDIHELSVHEILKGVPELNYIGLIPLCEKYISEVLSKETRSSGDNLRSKLRSTASPMNQLKTKISSYDTMSSQSDMKTALDGPNQSNVQKDETASVSQPLSSNQDSLMDLTCYPEMFGRQIRAWFSIYAQLHLDRASGKRLTCAKFLRNFILKHPQYRQDSIINPSICYDVTVLSILLGFGIYASVDIHGELIARHLIQQTPLPADLVLPSLSSDAMKLIKCYYEKDLEADTNIFETDKDSISSKFIMIKRRTIALNEINSIYTMPLGVTKRIGHLQKFAYESDEMIPSTQQNDNRITKDLALLTNELFDIQSKSSCRRGNNPMSSPTLLPSVISSEEFTQAWILKGIDCVGGALGSDDCTDKSSEFYSHVNDEYKDSKKSQDILERASTICPSACDEFCLDDMNDRLHVMSGSYNLGFKDEQELEYFHQVCRASG